MDAHASSPDVRRARGAKAAALGSAVPADVVTEALAGSLRPADVQRWCKVIFLRGVSQAVWGEPVPQWKRIQTPALLG